MMLVLSALGASFAGALRSPPGWYLYLPSPEPVSHGMPALDTGDSEVDVVGEAPFFFFFSRGNQAIDH